MTAPDDPCVGFIPVFTTREAALEFVDGDTRLLQELATVGPEPASA